MDSERIDSSSAPESDATRKGASPSGAGASTPPPDERDVRAHLRRWILDHGRTKGVELTDQTPILEAGLLSSLDIVELVLFLEELRGAEIETDALEPEFFTSVDTLWASFFAAKGPGTQP